MSTPFEPIKSADISWRDGLPYSKAFDDIYYSKNGGLAEAEHVFIAGNQLPSRWQSLADHASSQFVIAETGFGSALNFLLSWSLWKKLAPSSARLHFVSCEHYPLKKDDLAKCLALWPQLQEQAEELLANYPILTPGVHRLQFEEGRVTLTLMLGDALECYRELLICGDAILEPQLRDFAVDAWFLDGFTPAKNPLMWSESLLATLAYLSKPGTSLATYSVAGLVKQGLTAAGFKISKKPGHGLKRDMLVAEFEQLPPQKSPTYGQAVKRQTAWHLPRPKILKEKTAIVIGAGLAGCYSAHALASRGWKVTLIDAEDNIAGGASGNRHAILYPQLSAFRSPLNLLMLNAYLYASQTYRNFLKKWPIGDLSGILQLATHQKERVDQAKLKSWITHYPELAILVDCKEASSIAGIALQAGGLFIPHSGWLDMPMLCQFLIQTSSIHWVANTDVNCIEYTDGEWHAGEHHAQVLVIANGDRAGQFAQTQHLTLKAIRGQMTSIRSNEQTTALRLPLCAEGHVLPAREGAHAFGATYHLGLLDRTCTRADDEHNLANLNALPTELEWPQQVMDHWAAIRVATADYLPLVGPVADAENFKQQYAGLASNPKRWIPSAGAYHPGLYICSGFGSRGLTTIPLCAEWLAATINKEPSSLPRKMIQSLSPARFLLKEMIRQGLRMRTATD